MFKQIKSDDFLIIYIFSSLIKNKNECFILHHKMQRYIFILFFLMPVFGFSLCGKKWKQTSSGLYYKLYTSQPNSIKPVFGDHIWMHLRKYGPDKKELFNTKIFDIGNGVEMEYRVPQKKGDITEMFLLMGKGDSALVKVPASLLDTNGRKNKYYTFILHLINFKQKDVYTSEKKEQYTNQILKDSISIQEYIKNYDIKACKQDENGNWFLRRQYGNGKRIKDGDTVSLHYIGKLTNNEEFDNSFNRNQLFTFIVGKNSVIEGLDKGIKQFVYGDKGILIIPSRYAYGDKEVGKIPANSILIFEMEIKEKE